MKKLLIFGLSGQVGDALLPLLRTSDYQVTAVSRQEKTCEENIAWIKAGFSDFDGARENYDAVISLGPLHAFSIWLASANLQTRKIVALGSTSIISKKQSPDAEERHVSQLLSESEQRLKSHAGKMMAALIVLRPTLIYGAGRDRSISRWLNLARRFKVVVLPKHAAGLRQPVHVADLADAVYRTLQLVEPEDMVLDLPGGEILPFDQMLLRSLDAHVPGTRVVRIPDFLFGSLLGFVSFAGPARGLGRGFFARLREDWVFDAGPARSAIGYQPRPFSP